MLTTLGMSCTIRPRHQGEATLADNTTFLVDVLNPEVASIRPLEATKSRMEVRFRLMAHVPTPAQQHFKVAVFSSEGEPHQLYSIPRITLLRMPRGDAEVSH